MNNQLCMIINDYNLVALSFAPIWSLTQSRHLTLSLVNAKLSLRQPLSSPPKNVSHKPGELWWHKHIGAGKLGRIDHGKTMAVLARCWSNCILDWSHTPKNSLLTMSFSLLLSFHKDVRPPLKIDKMVSITCPLMIKRFRLLNWEVTNGGNLGGSLKTVVINLLPTQLRIQFFQTTAHYFYSLLSNACHPYFEQSQKGPF